MATRRRRMRGDRAFKRLLRRLPDAIRDETVEVLDEGGTEILSVMQADAPVRTGAVKGALKKRVLRGALQLKVGLIGRPINRRLFYAWIIERGRKAQTVTASRGGAHRAIGGRLIGRRQRALEGGVAGVFRMRIRALRAQPFIYSERVRRARQTMGGRLRGFWERTLQRASEGATDQ